MPVPPTPLVLAPPEAVTNWLTARDAAAAGVASEPMPAPAFAPAPVALPPVISMA